MNSWLIAGGVVLGAGALALLVGKKWWMHQTNASMRRVTGETVPLSIEEEIDGLPDQVRRYFRYALPESLRNIRTSTVWQSGQFRMGGMKSPWKPFTAVQKFGTNPPTMVWDASITLAGPVQVLVRDSILGGMGAMNASVGGLFSIVRRSNADTMLRASLQRYLAECVWFPTALLPSSGVRWTEIDSDHMEARLSLGGVEVSLTFTFKPNGAIATVYSPDRLRSVKGTDIPTPWGGTYADYGRMEGVMVPRSSEVYWDLPEGRLTYFKGQLDRVEYAY